MTDMKAIIKITVLIYSFISLIACDDMNCLHEEYLKKGEIIYTGIIDSLKTYPGNNRVRFTWEINSDPRITKVVLYWNERNDSTIVQVNRTTAGKLPMETIVNLPEGTYIFEFATKDDDGHQSLYVEQSVEIYGDKLIQTLRNRSVEDISDISGNSTKVSWYPIEDLTIQYTTIKYLDFSDPDNPTEKKLRIENTEMETTLSGIRSGEILEVVSSHLPANGLDIIDALPKEYEFP